MASAAIRRAHTSTWRSSTFLFRLLCDDLLEANDFDGLKAVIVAHPGDLRPESLPLLRGFVESGGRMLVTGANNLQRELGIILAERQNHGHARQDGWYIHAPRDWNIPDWELACSLGHWPLRNFPGFGELAYSLKPVVVPHDEVWDSPRHPLEHRNRHACGGIRAFRRRPNCLLQP